MDIDLFQTSSTVALNLSLAWLVGVFFARRWLNETSSWCARVATRLDRTIFPALLIGSVSYAYMLWFEAAAMAETPLLHAGPAIWMVLKSTHYGHVTLAGLTAQCGLLCVHFAFRKNARSHRYAALTALLLLAFALSRATVSHAGSQGAFALAVWIDWMHLLLISLWVGFVMISGWLILPSVKDFSESEISDTSHFLRSLSLYATIAITGIFATGLYNALRALGSPANLFGQPYGNILILKICLVLLAAALGGFNRFIGLPAFLKPDVARLPLPMALKRIILVLRVESIVLLSVVVAAAVLAGTAPPPTS